MQPASAEFLAKVREGYELVTRVTLLDGDDNEVEELTGEDGYAVNAQVSVDRTRLPRYTVSLTVSNPNGLWTPRAMADAFWLSRRFKVQHGLRLSSGIPEYMTLGHFMVDRPEATFDATESSLSVQATDYWKSSYRRKNRTTTIIEAGMRLEEVVVLLGTACGFDPARMRLNDSSVVIAVDIPLEPFSDLPDELVRIISDHAHEVFFDHDGWLVLQPAPKSGTTGEPVFSFAPGDDSVLVGITRALSDEDLYNAVMVEAVGAQRPVVVAEARDLNPDSPAYNPPIGSDPDWPQGGPLGDRLMTVKQTSVLADDYAAYELAQALLWENSLVEETYSLRISPVSCLLPGDVVTLRHPDSGVDDQMLIDSLTVGTALEDEMTLSMKRLRLLSAP
jgi:hypothetical protein